MGLFSKKEKPVEYDLEECIKAKKKMREIYNTTVKDGDSYEILYAYMSSSKYEKGLVYDTNTTSFYYYIVGFRKSDFDLILIQIDSQLNYHSDAIHIEMDKIVNVSFNPKYYQLCFQYEKNYGNYGELLNIKGTDANTKYGPRNIYQPEEREKFLDFAESFRKMLSNKGFKLDKWKR